MNVLQEGISFYHALFLKRCF